MERNTSLFKIATGWSEDAARQDVGALQVYLQRAVVARISHAREWLDVNTERFHAENADLRVLKRTFEVLSDNLRSSIQLCRSECNSCRLPCILSKGHDASSHDCRTSHACLELCEYDNEHEGEVLCQLPYVLEFH